MSPDSSHHQPLQPQLYRLTQRLTAVVMISVVLAAPLQIMLAVTLKNAPLFYLTGVLSLLLLLPLMLYSAATPPVTVSETGLTLHPVIWPSQTIRWDQVEAIKRYPLLPPTDTETVRRTAVGRHKYQPADGLMLVIPDLRLPYRAVGFFTGEGLKPAVAFTNRSHTDYDRLTRILLQHLGDKQLGDKQLTDNQTSDTGIPNKGLK